MNPVALGDRVAGGLLVGLATFGVVSLGLLRAGCAVPAFVLPLCLGVGLCMRPGRTIGVAGEPAPAPIAIGLALLIVAVVGVVGFGALATTSRHWDGAVAWDVKARFLADSPTLEQPFFSDPNVLVHTRDYPLLQPLVVAAGDRLLGPGMGRLLFPSLLLLLALLIGVGLRRAGVHGTVVWLTAAGCVLVPRLANPTSGGADSGYADTFLLVATTALALGTMTIDPRLLASGAAIAVMVKPEGMVYAGLAVAVCWCAGERRRTTPVTFGWMLGALAWLPVQDRLLQATGGAWARWPVVVVIAVVVLLADVAARRMCLRVCGRAFAALALIVVAAVAARWVPVAGGGSDAGILVGHIADPARALRRLERLPAIVSGVFSYALAPSTFALAFVVPVVAAISLWWQRRRLGAPAVAVFVMCGLVVVVGAFLLSPEDDLDHHLRSSMSRLLLHWLGPVMLLAGVWSHALWAGGDGGREASGGIA